MLLRNKQTNHAGRNKQHNETTLKNTERRRFNQKISTANRRKQQQKMKPHKSSGIIRIRSIPENSMKLIYRHDERII